MASERVYLIHLRTLDGKEYVEPVLALDRVEAQELGNILYAINGAKVVRVREQENVGT